MKTRGRRMLLLGILLAMTVVIAATAAEGLPLKEGDRDSAVLEVKERLLALRYLKSGPLTKAYTKSTAQAVREFQRDNGLPETGEVDEKTREVLFSPDAARKPYPTMSPLAEQEKKPEPDWPERDAEGFAAGGEEYVYENDEAGLWIYLNGKLQIIITRLKDESVPLVWFETEIRTRDGERFRTVQTDPDHPGKRYRYPDVIAQDAGFVLGFSDDFFAARMDTKENTGIIIREGQLISRKTNRKTGHHLPNLDMMVQYPDGRLQVYECNEKMAEELLEEGAVNVFSFGPILLRDGVINELVYTYYRNIEPRHALGMIEPNHYLLLSVQGRMTDSRGDMLQRVAEIMKARGVTQALNLDGGNTMALVFRGRMLNKLAVFNKKAFVRTVTSLIGIGQIREE